MDQRATLELLYKVSREFATALDLKTVLQRVLFAAINNVGGERGSVVVMDDNGRAVDSAIVYGNQLRENTTIQLRETVERGLAGWVVRSREAALVPDTSKDERWLRREDDSVERSGAKSAICVPLLAREKLVGVLTLVHPVPGTYNAENMALMQAIADQAGVSVMNARLFSESQRQARVMTALAEGAVSMNVSLRVEETFERIMQQTRQALQVETVALGMISEPLGEIIFRAALGDNAIYIKGKSLKPKAGIAGKVAHEGRGLIVASITEETLLADAERMDGRAHALACAPIHAHGKVIGVLTVFNPINKIFDGDALLVLTGLGSLGGAILQNAQLYERLDAARRRYLDLFEDSIDPIVISDLKGYIQEANAQAATLSGYRPDELNQFLIEQMHDLNFEKVGRRFENLTSSATIYESTLYNKLGEQFPVEVYARKVFFDDVESFQWIFRDITVRKDLDILREDLAAMIYHDLRSPLANILSSIEMLDSLIPAGERENGETLMRIARHSLDRIQRLIASLLDLNRLEQNQPVGEKQTIKPADLIGEAIEAVKPGAEGRNQHILVEAPADLPEVAIDVDMIRRVLINLAENAIKYSPLKSEIVIRAQANPRWLQISVQDCGPGIPEIDRERVFDKFTRLKKQGGPGGLGVGLAFCKLAVQGHGGKIWIESAPEQGSKFIFTLPRNQ
ncbi:MAG: GAF domain-containing protein [Anaerolineales bacterium]|jgi:PAS domain S-box-containing protein|nr:GAF domain-containing protein [Anaerolineales bacterium]